MIRKVSNKREKERGSSSFSIDGNIFFHFFCLAKSLTNHFPKSSDLDPSLSSTIRWATIVMVLAIAATMIAQRRSTSIR